MPGWLAAERWSPYVVGAAIGVLSWLTFLLSDKALGCSTAFARTAGMLERLVRGRRAEERPYFRKFPPVVDWEWTLVAGVVAGALLAALAGGDFRLQWVPALWAATFGDGAAARLAVAFGGGILMGAGARWAGGCTSGHGISGTLQLAVSSWLAAICFFAGGIAAALVLFRLIGGG
ncbi:YeeE/YedE family protein [candidate division WOR-3 bacterium]|nr:YeeE/YedE family protein [candidate division WOR-3 bacterium]